METHIYVPPPPKPAFTLLPSAPVAKTPEKKLPYVSGGAGKHAKTVISNEFISDSDEEGIETRGIRGAMTHPKEKTLVKTKPAASQAAVAPVTPSPTSGTTPVAVKRKPETPATGAPNAKKSSKSPAGPPVVKLATVPTVPKTSAGNPGTDRSRNAHADNNKPVMVLEKKRMEKRTENADEGLF